MTTTDLVAFEARIQKLWAEGELPFLLHLAGGNEAQLKAIFGGIKPGDWVFASHRAHYHALLSGIPAERVESEIRAGRSMFLYSAEHNFCVSAVLAGTCAIAAGVALALKEEGSPNHVWCFLGDGAEEEGHFYEAALYAEGHALPVTFIIEDNGRQVDTTKEERRGGGVAGLENIFGCVQRYRYTPTFPHSGDGIIADPKYNPAIVAKHCSP